MPMPSSAVADAYARLTEVFPGPAITELTPGERAPSGDGRVAAASLAEGGAGLQEFLAWGDAQIMREYDRQARPDVIASFGRTATRGRPVC
jgi:hypothetical protein